MAAVMLFLRQMTGKTERYTHFKKKLFYIGKYLTIKPQEI